MISYKVKRATNEMQEWMKKYSFLDVLSWESLHIMADEIWREKNIFSDAPEY